LKISKVEKKKEFTGNNLCPGETLSTENERKKREERGKSKNKWQRREKRSK
jgi:hypothetical protein